MPSDSGPVMGGVELTAYPEMRFDDILGIGVKILEIELGNDLLEEVRHLAKRHYGNDEDASVSRVVENALDMRLLLSERLGDPGEEVGEPIIDWEPQEPEGENPKADITEWLFKRRPS